MVVNLAVNFSQNSAAMHEEWVQLKIKDEDGSFFEKRWTRAATRRPLTSSSSISISLNAPSLSLVRGSLDRLVKYRYVRLDPNLIETGINPEVVFRNLRGFQDMESGRWASLFQMSRQIAWTTQLLFLMFSFMGCNSGWQDESPASKRGFCAAFLEWVMYANYTNNWTASPFLVRKDQAWIGTEFCMGNPRQRYGYICNPTGSTIQNWDKKILR